MQNPPKSQVPPLRTGGPLPGQRGPGGLPRPGQLKPLLTNPMMEKPKIQPGFMPTPQEEAPIETKTIVKQVKQSEKPQEVTLVHHQQTPSFEMEKERTFSFNEKNEDPEGPQPPQKQLDQSNENEEDGGDSVSSFTLL